MRLIDADELKKDFLPEDGLEYDTVGIGYIIDCHSTINPIHIAGGYYCKECLYSSYDDEYEKRWCNNSGCREVKADGSGFCDQGEPREAQDI